MKIVGIQSLLGETPKGTCCEQPLQLRKGYHPLPHCQNYKFVML